MILINPAARGALQVFQPFVPVYVPIGCGSLLGVLERENIPSAFIDDQIEKDTFACIRRAAESLPGPHVFGFSVLTAAYARSIELARAIKQTWPDSVTLFGGVHPSAMPEEVLSNPEVDFVLRGEGERELPSLLDALARSHDPIDIPGLSFRKNNTFHHNPPGDVILRLDELPRFPYHRFDHARDRYDLGFVVSSRGCPHNCIFCSNRVTTGKRYRFVGNENVLADIELLREKYGVRFILFLDDNLLVNRRRIHELMASIRKRGYEKDMSFSFQARGDNVDRELLTELYASGFRSVFFGLETASERLMEVIDKRETVACCVNAVRMASELGFHVSATFMFALPGETHADRLAAAHMANDLQLDMVRFNNATPYPGTTLWDMGKQQGRVFVQGQYENFNSVSTFIENPFNKMPFSYVPEGADENRIRTDILASYLAFYMNWKRVLRIFSSGHREGVGWFSAGGSWRERLRKLPAAALLGLFLGAKFSEFLFNLLTGRHSDITLAEFARLMTGKPAPHNQFPAD